MKKFLFILILVALIMPSTSLALPQKATVFHPETGERKVVIVNDPFAFEGGFLLETSFGYVEEKIKEGYLGFSVVSDYSKFISQTISSTATEIPVTSMSTTDGHTLTMADLGTRVFLTLEPRKTSKKEIVMCTGITSLSWTGCTRGLAFYGTSTASVTANRHSHNSGSTITLSNVHYTQEQLVDIDSNQNIGGNKKYTGNTHFYKIPTATTTIATGNNQLITLGQLNSVTNQGAATSSDITSGISERATKAEISAGTSFDANNPHYISSEHATSTFQVATTSVMITESDGKLNQNALDLTENFAFSGNNSNTGTNTFSATTTISGNLISKAFGGTGSDGALNVTSGTTTITVSSANVVIKNYTSINIDAGTGLTLDAAASGGTILYLKSQGDCTIAGNIGLDGLGASSAVSGYSIFDDSDHDGGNGATGATGAEAVGAAGLVLANQFFYAVAGNPYALYSKNMVTACGSGGGNGGAGETGGGGTPGAGGAGGAGGGAIIIECGGYLNFTGTINVSGLDGSDGSDGSGGGVAPSGGGGGGGNAGMVIIIYNGLIVNSGTITTAGGDGGDAGDSNVPTGAGWYGGTGAGGGGSIGGAGGTGGDNDDAENCTVGSSGSVGAGGGGGGGVGNNNGASHTGCVGGSGGASTANHYLITQNLYF